MIDCRVEDFDIKSKLENLLSNWDVYTSYTKDEYKEVKQMLNKIYKIELMAQDRFYKELVEQEDLLRRGLS